MSTVKVFNPGRPSRAPISSLGSSGVYRPTLAQGHEASQLVRSRLVDMGIARPTKSRRVLLNNDDAGGGGMATANKPMKPIKKFKAKKLGKPRPVTDASDLTPPPGGFKKPKPVQVGKTKSSSPKRASAKPSKKASKGKGRAAANPKGATCPPKGTTISRELMKDVLDKARKGQALGKAAKGKSGDVKKMLGFLEGASPAKGKKASKKGKKPSKKSGSAVQRVARAGTAAAKRSSRRAKPTRARKASKPVKASKPKKTSKAKKASKPAAKKASSKKGKKPKKARASKRAGAAIQPARKKPAAKRGKTSKKAPAKKPAAKKRGAKGPKKGQTLLLSAAITQARGELMREIQALEKRLVSGAKKTSRSSSKGKTALVSLKGGAKGGARAASAGAKKAANPRRSDSVAVKTKKRKGAKGASKKAPKAKNPKKAKAKKAKAKKGKAKGKKRNQGAVAVTDFARNKPRKAKGKGKKKGKRNPTRNDVWSALGVSQGDHNGLVKALRKGFGDRDRLAKLQKADKAMAARVERALSKLEKITTAGYKRPDVPVTGPSQADIDKAIREALGLEGAARRSARSGTKAAKRSSKKKASKKASAKRNPAKAKKASKKASKKATKAKGKKSSKKKGSKKTAAKRSAKKGAKAAKKPSKKSGKKGKKKGSSKLGSALVKAQKSLTAEIRSLKAAVAKKRNPSKNQGAVAVTDFARNKGKKKNRPWPEIAANKPRKGKKGKKRNQGAVAVTDFARNPSRNQGGIDGAVEVAFGRQPIQTLGDVGLALPGFVLGAAAPGFVGGFMPAMVKNLPVVGPAVGPLLGAVLGVGAAGAISHFGSQNDMISGLPVLGRAVGLASRGAWFGAALGLARELVIAYTAPTSMVRKFVPGTSASAMADAVGLSDDDDDAMMGQAEAAASAPQGRKGRRGGNGGSNIVGAATPGNGFGIPMPQGTDFNDEISVDEGAPPIGGAMTPDEMADFAAPAMDDFAAPAMGDFAAPAMNDFAAPAMGDADDDDSTGQAQGVMDDDDAIADFAAPAMADFAAPAY